MNEFIEKLIARLEEARNRANRHYNYGDETAYRHSIEIVNQLAGEYNNAFCEWKQILGNTYITPTCIGEKYFEYTDMQFCPYCSKKIKILD